MYMHTEICSTKHLICFTLTHLISLCFYIVDSERVKQLALRNAEDAYKVHRKKVNSELANVE